VVKNRVARLVVIASASVSIIHFKEVGESHWPNKIFISLESSFSPPLCIDTYIRSLAILIPVYVCKFLMRSHEGKVEHQCKNSVKDTTVKNSIPETKNKGKNPVGPKLAHLLKMDNTVDSKLRNWYLQKYVRCYKQRNQFCIDKQMVFLSASF
jgi:hypothetical protein